MIRDNTRYVDAFNLERMKSELTTFLQEHNGSNITADEFKIRLNTTLAHIHPSEFLNPEVINNDVIAKKLIYKHWINIITFNDLTHIDNLYNALKHKRNKEQELYNLAQKIKTRADNILRLITLLEVPNHSDYYTYELEQLDSAFEVATSNNSNTIVLLRTRLIDILINQHNVYPTDTNEIYKIDVYLIADVLHKLNPSITYLENIEQLLEKVANDDRIVDISQSDEIKQILSIIRYSDTLKLIENTITDKDNVYIQDQIIKSITSLDNPDISQYNYQQLTNNLRDYYTNRLLKQQADYNIDMTYNIQTKTFTDYMAYYITEPEFKDRQTQALNNLRNIEIKYLPSNVSVTLCNSSKEGATTTCYRSKYFNDVIKKQLVYQLEYISSSNDCRYKTSITLLFLGIFFFMLIIFVSAIFYHHVLPETVN
ncbi:hypothetical protein NEOKW01_1699 [Nematocida sp. AWRm80]|nr:hypothetical protein NEOKW01_1699 [Nematocida sp. AWRm80]